MKVKDQGYKAFVKSLSKMANSTISIGAVGQHAGTDLTNADILTIAEFGTKDIAPRAPIRKTFRSQKNLKSLEKNFEGLARKNFKPSKGYNSKKILDGLGLTMVQMLKATFIRRMQPPNKKSTLLRKRGDLPFVETRQLLNSIDYQVKS